MTDWRFGPSDSQLQILTTATGAAAKLGHRLTLSVTSWHATVTWASDEPSALEPVADAASTEVLRGEGGATPLSGPERAMIHANAIKSLGVQKFPTITFQADNIAKTTDGYRPASNVTIRGTVGAPTSRCTSRTAVTVGSCRLMSPRGNRTSASNRSR
jgi:polyisoprenoid-binding protein YceI